jgi:hypothetical protein
MGGFFFSSMFKVGFGIKKDAIASSNFTKWAFVSK